MGCSPSKDVVVRSHPTEPKPGPVPVPSDNQNPTEDDQLPVEQSGLHFKVNDAVPDRFFLPHHDSALEMQCRATSNGLAPKQTEASLREEVNQLLEQWENSLQLGEIENHALSVPPRQTTSVKTLAASLTSSQAKYRCRLGGNTLHLQLAKAYAIYFWVATNIQYDVTTWHAYLSGDIASEIDAETVLQERVTVCLGYARLFRALASEAGLQAEVVRGCVRPWRVLSCEGPDSRFEPNRESGHDWNAVNIGGIWFPLDCTYGSGYVGPQMQFTARYSRAYFAAPPEKLVLTHLPSDEAWQLLQHPVAVKDLQPLIAPQLQVFTLGVEPKSWSECIHIPDHTADPVVSVCLKAKPGLRLLVRIIDNDILEMQSVQTLSTSTSQGSYFIRQCENDSLINALVPHKGRFTLVIHAHNPSVAARLNGYQQTYQLCLTYQVTCDLDLQPSPLGYPIVQDLAVSAFDFSLLHWNLPQKSYVPEATQGRLELVFRAQPDLQYFHCLVPGQIKSLEAKLPTNAHNFSTLLLHDSDDAALHALRVVFPHKGWWTVCLCATRATNIEGTVGYTSLLSYTVLAKTSLPNQSYPHLLSSEGVCFESTEPISTSGREVLAVPFACTKPLDFHCYISHDSPNGEAMEEYTRVELQDANRAQVGATLRYALKVIFPKPGKWYMSVLAKDSRDAAAEAYAGLFSLCIEVEGCAVNLAFPSINKLVADELGIRLLDHKPVSFADDGNPFAFKFLAPRAISVVPKLKSCSRIDLPEESDNYVDYCTLIRISGTDSLATYTLKVIFPKAGRWSVQLFAGKPESAQYNLAIQISLDIQTPMPGVAYPKLFSAFHNLGLTVPPENELYLTTVTSPEFKFPFHGPERVRLSWDMRLATCTSGETFPQNAFVHYPTEGTPEFLLHLVFPKMGEWVVRLFAGRAKEDPSLDTVPADYKPVMFLRLTAMECMETHAFPQIFESFNSTFGLTTQGDVLPLVSRVTSYPQVLVIPFHGPAATANVHFWHEVELEGRGNQEATRMSSESATRLHQLEVEVSEPGKWTVTLYANRGIPTEKDTWTAVLCHVVNGI